MCHFVSWIEYKGKVYYLNDDRLNDRRGKELRDYETDPDEWRGHGSILWYYGLKRAETVQQECSDFSDPANFPPEIVEDIKEGKFRSFGICPEILAGLAREEYQKIVDRAREEYEKITGPAWKEYWKITGPAWEEYEKIVDLAREEYEKIVDRARAEYYKILNPARAEYEKIVDRAREEYEKIVDLAREEYQNIMGTVAREGYEKIVDLAWAEYEKVKSQTFWPLASKPENRIEAWR
jgi:F0F1-type ATP synthase membrane subunit b/b'